MASENYDFGGHIEDDTDVSPRRHTDAQEERLSPYGLLVSRVGHTRAKDIFAAMQRLANLVTEQHGSGVPGIAFDVDGGRFVSIIGGSDNDRGF
jgi:hypothetical protein